MYIVHGNKCGPLWEKSCFEIAYFKMGYSKIDKEKTSVLNVGFVNILKKSLLTRQRTLISDSFKAKQIFDATKL